MRQYYNRKTGGEDDEIVIEKNGILIRRFREILYLKHEDFYIQVKNLDLDDPETMETNTIHLLTAAIRILLSKTKNN